MAFVPATLGVVESRVTTLGTARAGLVLAWVLAFLLVGLLWPICTGMYIVHTHTKKKAS